MQHKPFRSDGYSATVADSPGFDGDAGAVGQRCGRRSSDKEPSQRATGSRRAGTDVRITSALAVALISVGAMVAAGWIFRLPTLTQILPGYTSMVFNTALCFALLGLALLRASASSTSGLWQARGLAGAVGVLAALNLVQIGTGVLLGINLPSLHAWMRDGNPAPGQMASMTSVEFLLAVLGFLLMHSAAMRNVLGRRLARALSSAVFGIGAIALTGYVLPLEELYSWHVHSRMAVHTAAGMVTLGLALWTRQGQLERHVPSSDSERIVDLGTATVVLIALVAGISGAFTFKQGSDRQLSAALEVTQHARSESLATTLDLRAMRAAMAAAQPAVRHLLQALAEGTPDGPDAAGEVLTPYLSFGFSSVQLLGANGAILASVGQALEAPEASVPVRNGLQGSTALHWRRGLVLRHTLPVDDAGRRIGFVVSDQQVPLVDRLLSSSIDGGDSETELCGPSQAGLVCFPNRFHAAPYRPVQAPQVERSALLAARSGVVGVERFRDGQGRQRLIAYGPVGDTALVATTAPDHEAYYGSLRRRLSLGVLLVALVTLMGAAVLRRSVRPLTQRMAATERRHRAVLESLHEGVMLQDRHYAVRAANTAAARILGVSDAELYGAVSGDPRWQLTDAEGRVLKLEDYPTPRALRTGAGETDVPIGMIDASGRLRWLEVSTMPVMDEGEPAVVLTLNDVTEHRLAQQRLRNSEERFRLMVEQVEDYSILMLDAEGLVESWNRGAQRIMGYCAEEIVGHPYARFYTAAEIAAGKPEKQLETATLQGRCEEEGWRVRKDGTQLWAHVIITPVRNVQGNLMGYTEVTHDLTARRSAEHSLAEAARLVRAMIDGSPFGIVATDLKGLILAINPAGERMVGYSAQELVGRHTPAIYHDAEEIRLRARDLSEETGRAVAPGLEAFVHKARQGLDDRRDWTCVRKDGTRFPIHSTITPLRDAAGQIVGFMGIAFDATELKRREEYAQRSAHHDFLTGLPGRGLMSDRLDVAIRQAHRDYGKVGVLMIDLDYFKRINDALGHHVGDEVLLAVADRLQGCVRDSDTVVRMGGDEFLILLPDLADSTAAERVATQVIERVSARVLVGDQALHVTPSIGIALYPDDALNVSDLLRDADAAMFAAKMAGRGCYRRFSQRMRGEAGDRLAMESDLRVAMQREELEVHYQPLIALDTGDVIGMEALLRWTHPQRGPIPPALFIPVAEESGLIGQLGEWALRTACRGARTLQTRTGRPLRLSVNLSPWQFRSPQLPQLIESVLRETGLDPRHLEVEITEGMLMDDPDEAIQRLHSIHQLGATIAVDDFGTGYSSLSYISRFSIDTLKIDKSFVSRLPDHAGDAAVAQAIVAMSHSLGFKVVAEGVETPSQLAFLRAKRCDSAQGFLFGPAVPQESFGVPEVLFSAAVAEKAFAASFEALQEAARARVHAVH